MLFFFEGGPFSMEVVQRGMYQISQGERGHIVVTHGGHKYGVIRRRITGDKSNSRIYFRCSSGRRFHCKMRGLLSVDGTFILRGKHCHYPN